MIFLTPETLLEIPVKNACKVWSKFMLNLNVNISSNLFNQEYPIITNTAEINFLDNEDNFSDQDWNSLYKLSEETFVEETDSLKQGAAGAGLTDND